VFRPDAESSDAADAPPRRSRSEGGSPARKTPAVLIVVPAIAAALLVYGGTLAGVIIKERPKKEAAQAIDASTGPPGVAPGSKLSPIAAGVGAQAKGNQTAGPAIGKPAPEISGEDLDGQQFKLSDYRGKVVLLDFWGNW